MELFVVDRRHFQRPRHEVGLSALCAFNRINALSCIMSARHGWLGASYSVAELLTVLYFELGERDIILSKGHAAAMQYACLYGLGLLEREQLLAYKHGPRGLPAHTERGTPGILFTTGSLGQSLSRAAALALCRPAETFFVVLGDGELQEGQCFEGLQTVVQRRLCNLVTVIDLNGYQSELPVSAVKRIADYGRLLEGLGLEVATVDGHDVGALASTLASRPALPARRPMVLLSRTRKAGGTALLPEEHGRQPWHARVPEPALYWRIVDEQLERAGLAPGDDAELREELARVREHPTSVATRAPILSDPPPGAVSTRDAFARRLTALVAERPELAVLDADLAHSCGLDPLVGGERFHEMGIAEQDMVSFAGGLALAGRLPVVNTYAAFLKRACEQIYLNQIDNLKVIYAGHYAGLCYFTDGKTHQSLVDLSLMLALPDLYVLEPCDARHCEALLDWAVREAERSVYFRLRRTPLPLALPDGEAVRPDRPLTVGDRRRCLWTMGSVSTRLALDALAEPRFAGFGLVVQSVLRGPIDLEHHRRLLADTELIITIEEDLAPGALHSFVCGLCQRLGLRPRVLGKSIDRWGASFRTLQDALEHFGYTTDELARLLEAL
jgi:transketolase